MGNPFEGQPEHSAEYFGDVRDHWWNRDFLALVARRWSLGDARDILDVGCGVGHWGRLVGSVTTGRITGVDREPRWVAEATKNAPDERYRYLEGDAAKLPFPDASFDLVTCQTVLIHMADPLAVIAEMMRVTRPGGLVLAAEPNNLSNAALLDSTTSSLPVDAVVDLFRFQLTCERGKVALGEGDNSLGDRVPGLFAAAGLADVSVYTNDKTNFFVPPYVTPAEQAFVEDERDRSARGLWNWSEEETRRYFLAGGGRAEDFAGHFARGLEHRKKIVRAQAERTHHGISSGAFYLVAGWKR